MISILGTQSDGKKTSQKSQVGTAASFLEGKSARRVQLVVSWKTGPSFILDY